MSIFNKNPEQKAAKKADKKARKAIVAAHSEAITSALGKSELLSSMIVIGTAAETIKDTETIITAMTGEHRSKNACMVLTDERIIITYGVGAGTVELPYNDIDRVDTGRKFSGAWVELHNGSQTTELKKSLTKDSKLDDVKRIVREQQGRGAEAPASSGVADLAKLAELHASGVLTDEEFSAAKAKALGI
ncbi:MAG TPA: SHOCT domain-containing protein [Corynebacterium amycolatum]|nr:SHOCT domain-containing protein [Corynebacterium amycolatum]